MRKSKSRFFSIFGIVAIGVSFFAGVTGSPYDMRATADEYFDKTDLMDFRLVSTYGFDEDDISALREIEGAEIYPSYYTDVLIYSDGASSSKVARLYPVQEEYSYNTLTLKEGRYPEAENECMVDSGGMVEAISVGSTVTFYDHENDLSDTLSCTEYTVVGMFKSPMYVDKTVRGNTNVGGGTISTAIYIPEDNFLTEYYTQVFVRIPELEKYLCYGDEYEAEADKYAELFEQKADIRSVERLDKIKSDAYAEIDDAKKELADGKAEADEKIADAQKELDEAAEKLAEAKEELDSAPAEFEDAEKKLADGRKEIDDGYAELEKNRADYKEQIADAEKQLEDNRKLLDDGEKEYNDGLAQFNDGYAEYEKNKTAFDEQYAQYEAGRAQLDEAAAQLEMLKAAYGETNEMYIAAKAQYDAQAAEFEAYGAQLESGRVQLETAKMQLDEVKAQLDAAKAEIDSGRAQLADGEKELAEQKAEAERQFADAEIQLADAEKEYENGVKELADARQKYEDGLAEYEDGYAEYADGLEEFEKEKAYAYAEIADAEKEIADAEKEVDELKEIEWYVFDRGDNPGYTEYGSNADRIANIATVFPVFFILVAMLVCLTTMSRMVEEQRTQIGTLKALGYGNGSIIFKFMFYAVTAALSGAVFGYLVGMKVFPATIITAYSMMYDLGDMVLPYQLDLAVISVLACTAAIAVTVYAACSSALREQSAQLMRPKPPKQGKRIFLERITFIWKRFNFSNKVTTRNLFRYKRKMFMSVIGIAGCTALLLTGCALFDSVNDIIDKQYTEILQYDGIIAYDSEEYPDCSENIVAKLDGRADCIDVYQKNMKISANGKNVDAYVAVPMQSEQFTDFVVMRDRKSGTPYTLGDGEIYIDEKLASLLGGVVSGDTILIYEDDTKSHSVTVTAYIENYPQHYVYMSEKTYAGLFGEIPEYNVKFFSYNGENIDEGVLSEDVMSVDGVLAVSLNTESKKTFSNMLESLSLVIVVIIVSAGVLAFIVMYNLTNINITERMREIATLKVLGFYDGEVDSYVFRENFLLTLIGTAAGLVLGTFLAEFVITTAEVDLVMFGRNIYAGSYIIASLLTLAFSSIVSVFMHSRLKKIDMIEALKSVE